MNPSRAVCVLARAPSAPGKTRLTRGLSETRAWELRRALLLDTVGSVIEAGLPAVLCYTPVAARDELEEVARVALGPRAAAEHTAEGFRLIPQAEGNLGERMQKAFDSAFACGCDRVVLIGSDLPTLPPDHLVAAMAALDRVPVVIGPAEDGGYYLIGMRERHPELFDGIEWGSARVLAQTSAVARAAALPLETIVVWHDVDAPDDLRRVASSDRARHTRAWLMRS